jgi:hypothetical protein
MCTRWSIVLYKVFVPVSQFNNNDTNIPVLFYTKQFPVLSITRVALSTHQVLCYTRQFAVFENLANNLNN